MRTILIVDDNHEYLIVLKSKLEKALFAVRIFSSCVAAMEYTSSDDNLCDLVLADLRMPDASGLDLLASMRENGITVPFILMTADKNFDSKKTGKMGGQGTLIRPFTTEYLIKNIEALVPAINR